MFIVHNFRLRRILSSKQRRPGRIAKRVLRVGAIESDAARCKSVEVRCFDDLVAVNAEHCSQIIRGDQNDVVSRLLRRAATSSARQESRLRRKCNEAQANRYDYASHSDPSKFCNRSFRCFSRKGAKAQTQKDAKHYFSLDNFTLALRSKRIGPSKPEGIGCTLSMSCG